MTLAQSWLLKSFFSHKSTADSSVKEFAQRCQLRMHWDKCLTLFIKLEMKHLLMLSKGSSSVVLPGVTGYLWFLNTHPHPGDPGRPDRTPASASQQLHEYLKRHAASQLTSLMVPPAEGCVHSLAFHTGSHYLFIWLHLYK